MDPATINQLISAGAGVTGAVIGASATLLVGRGQRKHQERTERERLIRVRQEEAAQRVGEAFALLTKDETRAIQNRFQTGVSDEEQAERAVVQDRVDAASAEIKALALFLPDEIQDRIADDLELVEMADEFGVNRWGTDYHYHSFRTILPNVRRDVQKVLAAFLRREAIPERSRLIREYEHALAKRNKDRDEEFAEEIHEVDQDRVKWLEQNPDFKP
ncbi:hypothetical protein AB0M83_02440 [Amycolatopsis sp. NPDC051106]|uniref:hypothetical protein n=1 Tax=unclassified Amycolatopsis TaxID=2618356 RepID=UPI003424C4CF